MVASFSSKLIAIAIMAIFVSGCTTHFPNAIPKRAIENGAQTPTVVLVEESDGPAAYQYRVVWPVKTSNNTATTEPKSIAGEIGAEVAEQVVKILPDFDDDYYKTIRNNFRHKRQIYVSGFEHLDQETWDTIFKNGTRTPTDADRGVYLNEEGHTVIESPQPSPQPPTDDGSEPGE